MNMINVEITRQYGFLNTTAMDYVYYLTHIGKPGGFQKWFYDGLGWCGTDEAKKGGHWVWKMDLKELGRL